LPFVVADGDDAQFVEVLFGPLPRHNYLIAKISQRLSAASHYRLRIQYKVFWRLPHFSAIDNNVAGSLGKTEMEA
jgi:hypothetical protein